MQKPCNIRSMTPSDCPRVAQIDSLCISNPWSEEDFRDAFRYPENHYLVAEWDGEIAGFVGLIQFVDDGDITHIAVLPPYRKKQIATELLETLFCLAREQGMIAIHLEVRQQNKAAQNLYEKMGFETLAVRKNYYTNPREDAIVMVKHL
ncbi:MAG: ribosomal protein S18-alanine N-acetyltransferase [Lachnospiraceae bacterium]|nr:ribosomal protein S18-alanine N-acetyltransferase [Lachnospiraceae bacterium]